MNNLTKLLLLSTICIAVITFTVELAVAAEPDDDATCSISVTVSPVMEWAGNFTAISLTAIIDADGDYWAAAMVGLGGSEKPKNGVQVKLRTASGIFIHVARRNYIERGSVIEANINIPEFDTTDNLTEKNTAEAASEEVKKNQVLKINSKLKNDGLVSFLARGKAYLYSGGWRRVATIPLHASRRRVLPGDSRWFTGVMAQPLPAGQYKLRTFFASDSKYRRKMTRDMEFTISEDMAGVWAENFVNEDTQTLEIKPQQIELQLNPGRLTAARFQVSNQSLSTIVANCRIDNRAFFCKESLTSQTFERFYNYTLILASKI